jgi:hypothetical protein
MKVVKVFIPATMIRVGIADKEGDLEATRQAFRFFDLRSTWPDGITVELDSEYPPANVNYFTTKGFMEAGYDLPV